MKILSLKARGIGRFVAEVSLPIAELGAAEVVAIVGNNGEGKTTAVECFPAALYRMAPSRGPIASLANSKDSMVEAVVEVGADTYTLRLLIDGVVKPPKTEAYITDGAGKPLNDGKCKTYDAEISKRLPSQEVLLSSAFASQGGEGRFLSLPPTARKELFAQMLGLGRLQALAEAAGKHAAGVEVESRELEAKRQTLAPLADQAAKIADNLETAQRSVDNARIEREACERHVAEAREAMTAWQETHARLERAVTEANASSRDAEQKRDHADQMFRRDVARLAELNLQREQLTAKLGERDKLKTAAAMSSQATIAAIENEITAVRAKIEEHRARLRDWEQAKTRAERLLDATENEHNRAVQVARTALDSAVRDAAASAKAAEGLGQVPCRGDGDFATCPLIATAARARHDQEVLALAVTRAESNLRAVEADTADVDKTRQELAGIGAMPVAPEIRDLTTLEASLRSARVGEQAAAAARAKLDALADVEKQLSNLEPQIKAVADAIASGKASANELDGAVMLASMAVVDAQAAASEHSKARPPEVDESELRQLRAKEADAAATVTRLTTTSEQAQAAAAEIATIAAGAAAKSRELDEWRHLQTALGRNGIQALEIDAAGPEVSALCNELITACYGSRFAVSLETTALKADGSGTKEVFELRVIDTERGTEGSADQLSGGEKVLVSEALSLAIAIYNTRRSSIPMLDLFRDECAGALSHGNAVRYVEMLRRAVRLGGFHRVYFIAHQRELWDLADERILFADGTCRIAGAADIVVESKPADRESEAPAGESPQAAAESPQAVGETKKRRARKPKTNGAQA